DECKASVIGDYVANKLDMEDGETPVAMLLTSDFKGFAVYFYENGKVAKIPLSQFETKLNRKRLMKAYCDKSELVAAVSSETEKEYAVFSSAGRMLLVNSALVPLKQSKDTLGVNVMTLKKGQRVTKITDALTLELDSPHRYRTRNLPAAGAIVREEDIAEQLSLL
ncbi:MAG: topoisomerase IV, partial [Ruminococcaceae bacterium]|nr:topoisomerase IV [Oscillospiraceae bacterium]